MALVITDKCIACDACLSKCPHFAIIEGEIYIIKPKQCDECKNLQTQQCVEVCPVDAIVKE